jgi:hypothetical protein
MPHLLGYMTVDVCEHYLAPRRRAQVHYHLSALVQLAPVLLAKFRPCDQATPCSKQPVVVQKSRYVHELLAGNLHKRMPSLRDLTIMYVCTATLTPLSRPMPASVCCVLRGRGELTLTCATRPPRAQGVIAR